VLQAIAAAIRVGRPLGILIAAVQQRPWPGEAGWRTPCLTSEGTAIASATLDDNESARHFAALLPLELVLKDYAAAEKIADLPGVLPTSGAPPGYVPSASDLSYYGQPRDLPSGWNPRIGGVGKVSEWKG